jgi:hypothetical protein
MISSSIPTELFDVANYSRRSETKRRMASRFDWRYCFLPGRGLDRSPTLKILSSFAWDLPPSGGLGPTTVDMSALTPAGIKY